MSVGMLPKGPPLGRPGFGSQVSNWLGAPHSHNKSTFFCAFRAASAKTGLVKSPLKLATAVTPEAANPLRNRRRCSRCSSGEGLSSHVNDSSKTPDPQLGPTTIVLRLRPACQYGSGET